MNINKHPAIVFFFPHDYGHLHWWFGLSDILQVGHELPKFTAVVHSGWSWEYDGFTSMFKVAWLVHPSTVQLYKDPYLPGLTQSLSRMSRQVLIYDIFETIKKYQANILVLERCTQSNTFIHSYTQKKKQYWKPIHDSRTYLCAVWLLLCITILRYSDVAIQHHHFDNKNHLHTDHFSALEVSPETVWGTSSN